MGFWIFMLACNLVVPALLLGFGQLLAAHPPAKINGLYGYRTRRSMQGEAQWRFAQQYCGRLWRRIGLCLLPVSLLASVCMRGLGDGWTAAASLVLEGVQVACLLGSIYPVERALRRRFGDGKP